MPKVSVIIPNYNHAAFLEQRIDTVLNQSYQDFEVILLDDASTDNSREILAKYTDCSKVRTIFNTENSGSPFKQWNKGVSCAEGEYIWIAESDDYTDPLFLETLVSVLDQYPNVGLSYCQSCLVDQNNQVLSEDYLFWTDDLNPSRWKEDFTNAGTLECQTFLVCKNIIPNASAVLFRRNLYSTISRENESFKVAGDWITWVELLLRSDVYFIAKPLNYFRAHDDSTSRNFARLGLVVRETLRIIQFISVKVGISPKFEEMSFNNLFNWWISSLWSDRVSWRDEIKIFFVILFTFKNATLQRKACMNFMKFLVLRFRNHLKLGTKLRSIQWISYR